jgi:ABC-type polysaccharide/polyol phosphate export permease
MRSLSDEITINSNEQGKINFRELWLYRELFYFFAWRDIKVRYKQTILGAGWAILQPALATGVFTLFFNRVAKISSGSASIPYPVFAYLGLMYWNAFASAVGTISNSLVGSAGVMGKIYFPRLIPPLSASALSVVDFFGLGVCADFAWLWSNAPLRGSPVGSTFATIASHSSPGCRYFLRGLKC